MSTPEHGGASGDPHPDPAALRAAWLGVHELGPQPGFSAMIDALRTLQDAVAAPGRPHRWSRRRPGSSPS